MKIRDIPNDKRPRERAFLYGLNCLNDYEVLAIIIGSGIKGKNALEIANDLINSFHGLANLSKSTYNEIKQIKGLNNAKSLQIATIFELIRRIDREKHFQENARFSSTNDFYKRYKDTLYSAEKEQFFLVLYDDYFDQIKLIILDGKINKLEVSIKEILSMAIKNNATKILVGHNHTGDDNEPSLNDMEWYETIKEKCRILNIIIIDNVIISKSGYFSFYEENLL